MGRFGAWPFSNIISISPVLFPYTSVISAHSRIRKAGPFAILRNTLMNSYRTDRLTADALRHAEEECAFIDFSNPSNLILTWGFAISDFLFFQLVNFLNFSNF